MKLRQLLPSDLFLDDNWDAFFSVIDELVDEYTEENLDTFDSHFDKDTATREDLIDLLTMVGFTFDMSLNYTDEYIMRVIESIENRIKYKTTLKSYKAVLYSLALKGNTYPIIEKNGVLKPFIEYDTILDIFEYKADNPDVKLTSHIYVGVECPYTLENSTTFRYPLPEHHYPFSEKVFLQNLITDLGYNPSIKATGTVPPNLKNQVATFNLAEKCYCFTGNQYVNTNWAVTRGQNWTVAMWVGKTTTTTNPTIFFGTRDSLNNEIKFGFRNISGNSTTPWRLYVSVDHLNPTSEEKEIDVLSKVAGYYSSSWNHYSFEFVASSLLLRVYVNTILVYQYSMLVELPTSICFIGALNDKGSPNTFFSGYIADVRLYNCTLSATLRSLIFNSRFDTTLNQQVYGNFSYIMGSGDIRKYFDSNFLSILKKDLSEVKKKSEVIHTQILFKHIGREDTDIKKIPVVDKQGNVVSDVFIYSCCTNNWTPNQLTPQLDVTPIPYKLDQPIAWTLDVYNDAYINIITTIKLGRALGIEVSRELTRVEDIVAIKNIAIDEKKSTNTVGTDIGKYTFAVDFEPDANIDFVSEIGLFDINDKLIYYIKTPPIYRIPNIGYRFEIDIIKV